LLLLLTAKPKHRLGRALFLLSKKLTPSADADNLTNQRDAFRGQPRSPNIVTFHMLVIVSSCTVVTWSLRRAGFPIFDFKKCHDLEIQIRGHWRSWKVVPFYRLGVVSC